MFIAKVHQLLISPLEKKLHSHLIFWFALSFTFALSYSFLALKQAFSSPYLIQDDARQHVFWMMRFIDPELFPNDLIANYFQSVAPAGYSFLYKLGTIVGINPFVFSKIIPLFLCLICTYYAFKITLEVLPIPLAGFMTTLVMNQGIWMKDDLVSATPRAFAYPLFLAFLYYVLRQSKIGVCLSIALLGLFYPHYVFVSLGILCLRLITWEKGKLSWVKNVSDYGFSGAGFLVGFLILLPYALTSSEYGPALTKAEAMQLREFFPNGRSTFFHVRPQDFWLTGKRSGMFPKSLFTPATQCASLFLPLILAWRRPFPLLKELTSGIWLIFHLLISSITMFFIAHAVLFKLHLPSRYTGISFRIIVAIGTGIVCTVLIDALFQGLTVHRFKNSDKINLVKFGISLSIISLMLAALVLYPAFVKGFPLARYKQGNAIELYEFFQQQPKDILIASVEEEVNQLPSFTQRSILVGREYAIPYQVGYYQQFQQRVFDLITAQYSPNLADVQSLINKYDIDFWMLHRGAFTPEYLANNSWLMQFENTQTALNLIKSGPLPALAQVMTQCPVFLDQNLIVLDAHCLLNPEKNRVPGAGE